MRLDWMHADRLKWICYFYIRFHLFDYWWSWLAGEGCVMGDELTSIYLFICCCDSVCVVALENSLRHNQITLLAFVFPINHELILLSSLWCKSKFNSIQCSTTIIKYIIFSSLLFFAAEFILSEWSPACHIHMTSDKWIFLSAKFHLASNTNSRTFSIFLFTIWVRFSQNTHRRRRQHEKKKKKEQTRDTWTSREARVRANDEKKSWNKNYVTGIWRIGEKNVIYIPREHTANLFCRSFAARQQGQIINSFFFCNLIFLQTPRKRTFRTEFIFFLIRDERISGTISCSRTEAEQSKKKIWNGKQFVVTGKNGVQ